MIFSEREKGGGAKGHSQERRKERENERRKERGKMRDEGWGASWPPKGVAWPGFEKSHDFV